MIHNPCGINATDPTQRNRKNVDCQDLLRVCVEYLGEPRITGGSHAVFKMPWAGDPRVNIQNDKGKAKAYRVRQVLAAIEKLKDEEGSSHEQDRS